MLEVKGLKLVSQERVTQVYIIISLFISSKTSRVIIMSQFISSKTSGGTTEAGKMERQLTAGVGGLPVGGRERVFEVLELILGQVQPLFLDAVDLLLCLSYTHAEQVKTTIQLC